MKGLRKEITWILLFKIVLLTVLWYVCFSKPAVTPDKSRQIFYSHVYGESNHVPNRSSR